MKKENEFDVPTWWNATDPEYVEYINRIEEDPMEKMEHDFNDRQCFIEEDERWTELDPCDVCDWEKSETDETFPDWMERNAVTLSEITICDHHMIEIINERD